MRTIRCWTENACGSLFRKLNILPVACQYILSVMLFRVETQNNFQTNLNIHGSNSRNMNHLHLSSTSLSCFQKGVVYSAVRIFDSLPDNITILRHDRLQFKRKL